jgi:hypothetical protein
MHDIEKMRQFKEDFSLEFMLSSIDIDGKEWILCFITSIKSLKHGEKVNYNTLKDLLRDAQKILLRIKN